MENSSQEINNSVKDIEKIELLNGDPNNIRKLINYSTPYILNGEFFQIISQEGESVTVKCCYCETRNIYKGSVKSTGNFHMHIKRKHPALLPRVHELKLNSFLNRKSLPKKRPLLGNRKCSQDVPMNMSQQRNDICLSQVDNNLRILEEKLTNNIRRVNDVQIKEENQLNNNEESTEKDSVCHEIPCIQEIFEQETLNHEQNPLPERNRLENILLRLEDNLRGIEKEMRLRNQIESNRLCLELAEFKFLHPSFKFNL